jgi:hypothetical protein
MDVKALEDCLARIVAELRKEYEARATILERRIEALEKQIDFDQRLSRLERRAGIENEAHLIRPEHASWRNGGGHVGDRRS